MINVLNSKTQCLKKADLKKKKTVKYNTEYVKYLLYFTAQIQD